MFDLSSHVAAPDRATLLSLLLIMSFFRILLVTLFFIHVAHATTKHSFLWPLENTKANSTYSVLTIGNYSKSIPHRDAITRALTAASTYWSSSLRLRVLIRYKNLVQPKLYAISKVNFVPLPDDPSVLIQNAAYIAATGSRPNNSTKHDIVIEINTAVKWHLNSSSPPPKDRYDLATVVLHELYKHFMFSGQLRYEHGPGIEPKAWIRKDTPSRFDTLVVNAFGCPILLHYRKNKLQLGHELTTSSTLNFINSSYPLLSYYSAASFTESVYAGFYDRWNVTSRGPIMGEQSLIVPDKALEMQKLYTNLSIKRPSTDICATARSSSKTKNKASKSKRPTRILHLPIWAFGLYIVFALILLCFCLFCICTMGALAKQKEENHFVKYLGCCCTGVEAGPMHPSEPTPVFCYTDGAAAKRYSKESSNHRRRSSMRNSIEFLREHISSAVGSARNPRSGDEAHLTPTPPPAVATDIEASQISLAVAAEVELPDRSQASVGATQQ